MDKVLAWSAASEGSGTEPESLALNKRRQKLQVPGCKKQAALKNEFGKVHGKIGHSFTVGGPDYIS